VDNFRGSISFKTLKKTNLFEKNKIKKPILFSANNNSDLTLFALWRAIVTGLNP